MDNPNILFMLTIILFLNLSSSNLPEEMICFNGNKFKWLKDDIKKAYQIMIGFSDVVTKVN